MSLDYVATGLPKAGDGIGGEFLDRRESMVAVYRDRYSSRAAGALRSCVRRALVVMLICVAGECMASCRRSEAPSREPSVERPFSFAIEPIQGPANGNSTQAQLTASDGGVLLSWLEHTDATAMLKFSELAGGAWATAKTVASSDDWFVIDADVPTVMRRATARSSPRPTRPSIRRSRHMTCASRVLA